MWRDPGTWIALGVSVLFVVVALVLHRVFLRILQQGEPPPSAPPNPKAPHE